MFLENYELQKNHALSYLCSYKISFLIRKWAIFLFFLKILICNKYQQNNFHVIFFGLHSCSFILQHIENVYSRKPNHFLWMVVSYNQTFLILWYFLEIFLDVKIISKSPAFIFVQNALPYMITVQNLKTINGFQIM